MKYEEAKKKHHKLSSDTGYTVIRYKIVYPPRPVYVHYRSHTSPYVRCTAVGCAGLHSVSSVRYSFFLGLAFSTCSIEDAAI